ncbi:MAG: carbamoyltransferase C-terminal domain-containing protein [Candidatus Aadella gelida]|nr:carbamoyltransferase C-terminal domain-containing protein [Candidatus Aadella gelida]
MEDKKTYILGISAFYHDAAAALICDGEIIAAAQEERFTRIKHDSSFPVNAARYCLKEADITIDEVTVLSYHGKPLLDAIKLTWEVLKRGKGLRSVLSKCRRKKLFLRGIIRNELKYKNEIMFYDRHNAFAASAFYPSPFEKAAVLITDGMEGSIPCSLNQGEGNTIKECWSSAFPDSLGFLYSAFTYYCGFRMNEDEYKLMGLAAYGDPVYVDKILKEIVSLQENGSFKLNSKYFDFFGKTPIIKESFKKLFNIPARDEGANIEKEHMDLARSIQVVIEEIIMKMVKRLHNITKSDNLCLSGQIALNCVANGKIVKEGPFKNVWIQPASNNAGGAIGSALIVWYKYLNKKRKPHRNDSRKNIFLGPSFSDDQIKEYLDKNEIPYKKLEHKELISTVSRLLAEDNVVGWFQGRMEFGPRALGARSILANPRSDKMKNILNSEVKFREPFRPFAPSILWEEADKYFDMKCESPYMMAVFNVKDDKLKKKIKNKKEFAFEGKEMEFSEIPAVIHVDHSARVQTVRRDDNPIFHELLLDFYHNYDCPVIVNTSFNVKGEPIVCTPEDAYKCFAKTNIDHLVLGSFLIEKKIIRKKIEKNKIKLVDKGVKCVYC